MKKVISAIFACAALSAVAVDFDFTASTPAAKGKVPMIKLDAGSKIGGTAGRTALHFDGTDKATVIPGTSNFTLDKGVTVAFDIVLEKKAKGKKDLHMLLMKNQEWLIGKNDKNQIYINFCVNKKWARGHLCNADFSKPARYVITISKDLKIKIWRDGKLYHDASMKDRGTPDVGKNNVSIGCRWGQWGIQGDLFRLRIAEGVLSDEEIKGF